MILCRRPNQRRATYVDVFDGFRKSGAARHRRLEGVEIYCDQVDRNDPMRLHLLYMLRHVTPAQDTAMYLRDKRLDTPFQYLRKSRMF